MIRVLSIPENHPYPRALRPAEGWSDIEILEDEPTWWPHRGLTTSFWENHGHSIDVVHVHFGFEHLSVSDTERFVEELSRRRVPLIVTVHDLDNPHLTDQSTYHRQLGILINAAHAVLTLSDAAATIIHRRYGRAAEITPHPPVVQNPDKVKPAHPSATPAVFLKSLRANVVREPRFYTDLGATIYMHSDVLTHPENHELANNLLANHTTHLHEPMNDEELFATIASHPVVVLPYTRGTHSGWMRMCLDLGIKVAAPDCGCYASQANNNPAVETYRTGDGHDAARATRSLLERPTTSQATSPTDTSDLNAIHTRHHTLYSEVAQ